MENTPFHNYKEKIKEISCEKIQFTNSHEKSTKAFSAVVIDCCCFVFILIPITNIAADDGRRFFDNCCGRITG